MKRRGAVLLVLVLIMLVPNANAIDLDPACHQYYQMFQMPDLTYEDVGKIADKMQEKQCWPAMQGSLPMEESPATTANGLPSCEYLAEHLVSTSDNIRKLLGVRPMVRADCGADEDYPGVAESVLAEYGVVSRLHYDDGSGTVILKIPECHLLVRDPTRLSEQRSDLGFRPVNCRGKIVYTDGRKAGLYFYMEQYSDGDSAVWGANIPAWRW